MYFFLLVQHIIFKCVDISDPEKWGGWRMRMSEWRCWSVREKVKQLKPASSSPAALGEGLISMSWSNVGRWRASEGLIKCLKTGWHLWKMLLWIKQSSSWERTILSRTFTENGSLEKRFSGTEGRGHSLFFLKGDCRHLLWHYIRQKVEKLRPNFVKNPGESVI